MNIINVNLFNVNVLQDYIWLLEQACTAIFFVNGNVIKTNKNASDENENVTNVSMIIMNLINVIVSIIKLDDVYLIEQACTAIFFAQVV